MLSGEIFIGYRIYEIVYLDSNAVIKHCKSPQDLNPDIGALFDHTPGVL